MSRCLPSVVAAVALVLGTPMMVACGSKAPHPRQVTAADQAAAVAVSGQGEATLLLMADLHGVLRPCGCTVELQKGGFDRLIPYLADERKRYPDARLLHAGPIFYEDAVTPKAKKAQRERQSEVAAELLTQVAVDVAGATAVDLAASKGRLDQLVDKARVRLTAANLIPARGAAPAPWVVRQVGGLRVGIFALAGPDHAAALGELGTIGEPREAARKAVAALSSRSDVVVLLSALGLRETKRLVRKVDGIHFAVAGGLGEHPDYSDEAELVKNTRVMQFHREGRYVGRLSIRMVGASTDFADASQVSEAELNNLDGRIARLESALGRWERDGAGREDERQLRSARHHLASLKADRERLAARRVTVPEGASSFSFTITPLNWDLPQDIDAKALMAAFDEELKRINIAHAGTLPVAKPGEAVYVGVDTCLECHDEAQSYWDNDRHGKAWETLESLGKTFDAECVSCHVTGYNKAGGSLVGQTKGRQDVQCESCHGPGSLHAEQGDALDTIRVRPGSSTCVTCHNAHHSPNFDFAPYRQKLMVPGHGKPLN